MLYTALITKKKRLFQKAYTTDGEWIYITDTKRAKRKFLKSGIRDVVFNADVSRDEIFGSMVKPAVYYDEAFLFDYVEEMLLQLASFLKIELPVDTLAISDKKAIGIAVRYAKSVIVALEGEDEVIDGVNVIYTKRLHRLPDMAIKLQNGTLPPLPAVPTVDISEGAKSSRSCVSVETMCFKCDLLPYEISAKSLMYLLHERASCGFELTHMRKKLPPLFTFY